MNKLILKENDKVKIIRSEHFNMNFNKKTGYMERWGDKKENDPIMSPLPELLDIEISTICTGIDGKVCPFCYKANNSKGSNMSFDTFKNIIDSVHPFTTQVALGADSKCISNPDVWKMMEYSKSKGIIPNITVAQIDDNVADKLVKYCGAVAVSCYSDYEVCFDSVKKLTDRGMTQVNIHKMISQETFRETLINLESVLHDERLKKLNAFVFLSLKQKGRGTTFTLLSQENFDILINFCEIHKIRYGMDSCSSLKYMDSIQHYSDFKERVQYIEPCESSLFSGYFNVEGEFFPCSFVEGTEGWEKGIPIKEGVDFRKEIWYNERVKSFREKLLKSCDNNDFKCRNCPIFNV